MAEKHWREHRPKMVRDLERKGQSAPMLLEAEEKTKDEMVTLRMELMKQGMTAQQAQTGPGKWCGRNTSCCPPKTSQTATSRREPPKNLNSYRITEADRLGEGGPKQKFQQNLKAIETLRALDAEERPATPEEKATLVKYVGWGAMPQVFDVDSTDWRKEQIRLSEILSDEEHRSARATTLNAHYTAPIVIGAMYRAAAAVRLSRAGACLNPPAASATSSASCRRRCSAARPSPALKLIR